MSSSSQPDKPGTRRWSFLKRKRFWLLTGIVVYTLVGFFAVPAVVKTQLVTQIDQQLHRTAQVEAVEFNPYALSLSIQGFDLADTDGVSLVNFEELAVNFQLSSLFRWAWTFAEIRLDSPEIFYERFADGDSRLDRLISELAPTEPEPDPDGEQNKSPAGLPRLLIHSLALNQGQAALIDRQPGSPVELALGPIDIAVEQLNTLPDRSGQQRVAIQLPGGGKLSWKGTLDIAPFTSAGELLLDNLQLQALTPYLAHQLAIDDFTAAVSSSLTYQIGINPQGRFTAQIEPLNLSIDGITLTGLTPSTELIAIPRVQLEGGSIHFPEQRVAIQSLTIEQPKLALWRDPQGALSVSNLLRPADTPVPVDKAPAPESPAITETGIAAQPKPVAKPLPWQFALDEFLLTQGDIGFSDRSTSPEADVGLTELNLRVTGISNQHDQRFPVEFSTIIQSNQTAAGRVTMGGEVAVLPTVSLQTSAKTEQVELATLQPWLNQIAAITIDGGALDSDLSAELGADKGMTITGSINLADLNLLASSQQTPLGRWAALTINEFEFGLTPDWQPQMLAIGSINLQQPFARIAIDEQGQTNLAELIVAPDPAAPPEPKTTSTASDRPSTAMTIKVGAASISDGSLDFSDLSLPLPFTTVVNELNGAVTEFSNLNQEPAVLKLQGQVNQYGSAQITGAASLFEPTHATDVSLEFLNLELARVSPYSAQFAGRKIDQGKLDLNLQYTIKQGKLNAKNDIVLSDLQLGDKIDNPTATSLPLGLAVALLKDSKGVIDIKLPITGDLKDPEFKIGPVIWKTFAQLITRVATSPFRLLANLIGIDSDELGQFQFRPGLAALTPPELEKIVQLQEALQQRPNLVVEISGRANAEIDRPALALVALQTALVNVTGKAEGQTAGLDRNRKVLEKLFEATFAEIDLATVRDEHEVPPADNPDGKKVFDESAYITDLRNRLLASLPISDQQLLALANKRAAALKQAFIADDKLAEKRAVVIDPKLDASADQEWVVMELKITH